MRRFGGTLVREKDNETEQGQGRLYRIEAVDVKLLQKITIALVTLSSFLMSL